MCSSDLRRMIADHTKAHEQLKSIAKAKGIEMPNAPSDLDLMRLKAMGALAGDEFDNAYIKQEVEDHDAAVKLFVQESDNGEDAQLKSFAATTLPTLKEHLQMAESLPGAKAGGAMNSNMNSNSGGSRNSNSNRNRNGNSNNSNQP